MLVSPGVTTAREATAAAMVLAGGGSVPLLSRDTLPEDARRFIALCESGRLYDEVAGAARVDRDTAKREILTRALFSPPMGEPGEGELAFYRMFPSVMAFARRVRRLDYADLSRCLQRLESALILRTAAQEVNWCLTLHDGMLVVPKDGEVAAEAIRQAFARVGVSPTLGQKLYTAEEILRPLG